MSDDCLFCKIVNGDIPSNKVYEDELCYAFRDIDPQAPTHILVVPTGPISPPARTSPRPTPPWWRTSSR